MRPGLAIGVRGLHGDPLAVLRALLRRLRRRSSPPRRLPFCGGAVGVLGYELAEQLDVHRAARPRTTSRLPDAVWLFVDAARCGFDHERGARDLGLGFGARRARPRARARSAPRELRSRSDLRRAARVLAAPAGALAAPRARRRARRAPPTQGRRGDRRGDRRGRALPGLPHLSHRPPVRGRPVAALPRAAPPRSGAVRRLSSSCPRSRSSGSSPERFLRVERDGASRAGRSRARDRAAAIPSQRRARARARSRPPRRTAPRT